MASAACVLLGASRGAAEVEAQAQNTQPLNPDMNDVDKGHKQVPKFASVFGDIAHSHGIPGPWCFPSFLCQQDLPGHRRSRGGMHPLAWHMRGWECTHNVCQRIPTCQYKKRRRLRRVSPGNSVETGWADVR